MKKYILSEKTFSDIYDECHEYAMQWPEAERTNYLDALAGVMASTTPEERWTKLVGSGVFHDAIGKFVSMDDDTLVVATEY